MAGEGRGGMRALQIRSDQVLLSDEHSLDREIAGRAVVWCGVVWCGVWQTDHHPRMMPMATIART